MIIASITSLIHAAVDFHRGNFTPTTIVWTAMGAVGAVITSFNLRDALLDAESLTGLPSDTPTERKAELVLLAQSSIRQEAVRLAQTLAVTSIGIVVAMSMPVISDAQRKALHIPYWTPTGIAVTLALLTVVGLIVVQAALDRRLRKLFYSRRKNQGS